MSHDWSDDPRLLSYLLEELAKEDRDQIDRALVGGDEALVAELESLKAFLPTLASALALETDAAAESDPVSGPALGPARRRSLDQPGCRRGGAGPLSPGRPGQWSFVEIRWGVGLGR